MPKKLTPRNDRNPVAMRGKNKGSMNMPATRQHMNIKPSPIAMITIVYRLTRLRVEGVEVSCICLLIKKI